MNDPLPLLILAGSDDRPGPVPESLSAEDMLHGPKGALRLPSGRALIAELIERYRRCGRFAEPLVVGPREVYADLVDAEIVDVHGNLADTLECVRRTVYDRFPAADPVALSTCDILPTSDEVSRLLTEAYDPVADCLFWTELVEAEPAAMGASAWKPSYHFPPREGEPPRNYYPGHLVIARPEALRIRLTNHLLQLGYQYRNVELHRRYLRTIARGLGRLLWEDLRNLPRGKLPTLTLGLPLRGMMAYYRFRGRRLTLVQFERHVAKTFLHRAYHQSNAGRPVVFATTPILAFAKDIDTQAELAEAAERD